jgi:aminopeptidase
VIDPDAFAALLCDWCLEVAAEDQILIATTTLATPLVRALHRTLLERQAWPLLRLSPPALQADFYAHARDAHLDGFAPLELAEVKGVDKLLRIDAPSNTRALAGVDPALIARAAKARAPIQEARLARR